MPKSRIEKSESNSAHLARRNSLGGQSQVPISRKFRVPNSTLKILNPKFLKHLVWNWKYFDTNFKTYWRKWTDFNTKRSLNSDTTGNKLTKIYTKGNDSTFWCVWLKAPVKVSETVPNYRTKICLGAINRSWKVNSRTFGDYKMSVNFATVYPIITIRPLEIHNDYRRNPVMTSSSHPPQCL